MRMRAGILFVTTVARLHPEHNTRRNVSAFFRRGGPRVKAELHTGQVRVTLGVANIRWIRSTSSAVSGESESRRRAFLLSKSARRSPWRRSAARRLCAVHRCDPVPRVRRSSRRRSSAWRRRKPERRSSIPRRWRSFPLVVMSILYNNLGARLVDGDVTPMKPQFRMIEILPKQKSPVVTGQTAVQVRRVVRAPVLLEEDRSFRRNAPVHRARVNRLGGDANSPETHAN